MGLRNSAQSFQRLLDSVLAGMDSIYAYMDDILIFSKSESEHLDTLDELFKRLHENDLTISSGKCQFAVPAIDFLGHRVDATGIKPLPRKVDAIVKFPTPQKPKQLLSFLGSLNFHRRALPHLEGKSAAEHLQPLYSAATRKTPGIKFTDMWAEQNLDKSFEMAKKLLLCATKLVHPDPNAPLALVTDASKLAIGAVLETLVDGYWQPLGYYSKHLSEAQQRWSCFRRELFAIHQAMRHFRDETNGRHVTIFTDHEPLVSAFRSHSNNHDPVATNQLMEVSMYTNDVRYLPGRSNAVADLMSRP